MIVKFYFADSTHAYKLPGTLAIKFFDGAISGHFAIGLETYGEEHVYESLFPKSRKLPISEWLKDYKIIKQHQFFVPNHLQYKVLEWLEGTVNIRYSVEQIFFIGLCILFKPLDYLLNTAVINHKKALICSETGSRFVDRFIYFKILESHDKIGVRDMEVISESLEDKIMWVQD